MYFIAMDLTKICVQAAPRELKIETRQASVLRLGAAKRQKQSRKSANGIRPFRE